MFVVVYCWKLQRPERTDPFESMTEALGVAAEFRRAGFWASVKTVGY